MENPKLITQIRVLDLIVINGNGRMVEACVPSTTDAWFLIWVEEMTITNYPKYYNMIVAYNGATYRKFKTHTIPYTDLADKEMIELALCSYVLPGTCVLNTKSKLRMDKAVGDFLAKAQ